MSKEDSTKEDSEPYWDHENYIDIINYLIEKIKKLEKRVMLLESCKECKGEGKVTCRHCNDGTVTTRNVNGSPRYHKCEECNGRGNVPCSCQD